MENSLILGAGSFGTAIAKLLSSKFNKIFIWDKHINIIDSINISHRNSRFFTNIELPYNIEGIADLDEKLLANIDYIIIAVPSSAIRDVTIKLKNKINKSAIIINVAKGIDSKTYMRNSQVIQSVLPNNPVVVLSGPSHAEEIITNKLTTLVAASKEISHAKLVQEIFSTNYLRVYTNNDIIGVEIGGAAKNIIAIAAGIISEMEYGDNALAALITRGIHEIVRIGERLGAKNETFYGLSGIGDLIVTCSSEYSRNRRFGHLIGRGLDPNIAINEIGMVVEGVEACKLFYNLKNNLQIDMPITDALYNVLFRNKDVKKTINELMMRELKTETEL